VQNSPLCDATEGADFPKVDPGGDSSDVRDLRLLCSIEAYNKVLISVNLTLVFWAWQGRG